MNSKNRISPMVTCVMPTGDRPAFVRQAIRCFLRQSYTNSELVIVDDGAKPAARFCRDQPRVTYVRLRRPEPTGTKLNIGIEKGRGAIIQKIDDDDYYHPEFVAESVEHLPKRGLRSNLVARCCFLILIAGESGLRHSGHGWTTGGSLCFHRAMWKVVPFRDLWSSEDASFIRDHQPHITRICNSGPYIVVRHGANTWNRMTTGESTEEYFRKFRLHPTALRKLVPEQDWPFYRRLVDGRQWSSFNRQIPRP